MKKILPALILLLAATIVVPDATAQPYSRAYNVRHKQTFYYYPRANVYYDAYTREYIYPRRNGWVRVRVLPRELVVVNSPRFAVYNYGNDVWRYNYQHVRLYRAYAPPPPRVVVYQPAPYCAPGVHVSINARF